MKPPKLTITNHQKSWGRCNLCDLCETRKSVVLYRGTIGAPILMVGEAPGMSEDVIGRPFVGPAGKLLDKMLSDAGIKELQFVITNLIACIPKDEYKEITDPPKYAIQACSERLREFVEITKPKVVVWVGAQAKSWGPRVLKDVLSSNQILNSRYLVHPAAILRMHVSQRDFEVRRSIAILRDLLED